jgi:hypothetical protein
MRTTVAIDPGKDGCLFYLKDDGSYDYRLTRTHFTALTGKGARRDYRVEAMVRVLRELQDESDEIVAFLERQGPQPGEGSVSSFSMGFGYGLWTGVLSALVIPLYTVHPATWCATVLKGSQGAGKERAIFTAGRWLPGLNLVPQGCKKPHPGIADSACLAIYGRDFFKNGS